MALVRRLLGTLRRLRSRWPIDAAPAPVYVLWLLIHDVLLRRRPPNVGT